MLKNASLILAVAAVVLLAATATLRSQLPLGPIVLALGALPLTVLTLTGRRVARAVPDMVFGSIDTGLLTVPAVLGAVTFGVPGAVAGGVVGDAVTDAIAGLFEGALAAWLRSRGVDESREPVTTSLGKMAGCLMGSGAVLSLALLAGVAV